MMKNKNFTLQTVLGAVFLIVISQASAESLKVDFNGNSSGATIEQSMLGYWAYNAQNEVASSFGTRTYNAFGATITVTPSWSGAPTNVEAPQAWWRDNAYGYSTDPGDMLDLLIDWIGTDHRKNPGDPMTLTISGLPAGTYHWLSYHHDTQNQNGTFDVTVNDAAGSAKTSGLHVSNTQNQGVKKLADVSKFTTTITSDGVHPVTLVWDATASSPNFDTMFVINGFEISNDKDVAWHSGAALRRPISPEQPMWLIHIDTWNWPDPQKIIDMIPKDIRPYVVMNLSLSINHDANTGQWLIVEYGYETAKSWLRACAENQMWAMIQPASGGFCHFSDFDLSVYEEFYREYPNFIGFNYAEQFWGFDDKWSVTYPQRLAHWADLMKMNDRYGGYLVVSFTGGFWGASLNPVAMMKRDANFAAICKQSPDNFILCEKYTMAYGFHDIESTSLGAFLSGFSGNYGIRFDECGWIPYASEAFPVAAGAAPVIEHVMLTGETVIDGPELIWQQCIRGLSNAQTSDGYTTRRWDFFPQFNNISIDIFRKILDGTIRILSRKEVIDRTKVAIINNVNTGDDRTKYSSPETLFSGLYLMDDDGTYLNQKSWFKKTGRYPAIPTVYQFADSLANTFQVPVNRSAYSSRWPNITDKVNEFNNLFPEEYTGDLFAARQENGWVTYNPFKTGQTASGTIPFKYNTCDRVELTYSQYTVGVIKEYSDRLTFYLTNYDNVNTSLKTDVIKIYGSTSEPTWSYTDRASHQASTVTKSWSDGVLTLNVTHNGPLDIMVNCSGSATNRLVTYKAAALSAPVKPGIYAGPRQYEAENFDTKNIARNVTNGVNQGIANYTGQGYLEFGAGSAASVKDTVTVLKNGTYRLETKYAVTGANINTIDLYVNGAKVSTPSFDQTTTLSAWHINKQNIPLNAGTNTIEFRANAAGAKSIYFDNIVVVPTAYGNGIRIQENETGFTGVNGTVDSNNSGYTGAGYANTNDTIGAGIDYKLYMSAAATKSFTFRYACPDDRTADLIVDGKIVATKIHFPSTGSWSTWDFVTVYVSTDAGLSDVRLQSTSSTGLPAMDYMEVTGGGVETTPPAAPTGLKATAISNSRVDLNWNDNTESDLSGYNVYRATVSGGPYTLIASGVAASDYVDNMVASGMTYFYAVTAADTSSNESDKSNPDSATTYAGRGKYQEQGGILAMESENGALGSRWLAGTDAGASNAGYIEVDPAYDNTGSAPAGTTPEYLASYDFHISTGGNYRFWFRTYSAANGSDDSFFWRIDNGTWNMENNRAGVGSWFSTDNAQVDSLGVGDHVLQIAYRENGTRLDKFVIQLDSLTVPSGNGPDESGQVGTNRPPSFSADPLVMPNATSGLSYNGSIAGNASDSEHDPMTFWKVAGPAWLNIATDGTLSGTPGSGDTGLNTFTVQVNALGGSDTATLKITVQSTRLNTVTRHWLNYH